MSDDQGGMPLISRILWGLAIVILILAGVIAFGDIQ